MTQKPLDQGLMELTHREVVAYGIGQKNLTLLELELLLRLEQMLDAREQFTARCMEAPCAKCAHFVSLLPDADVVGERMLISEATPWQ
jgi:hypothetical protein